MTAGIETVEALRSWLAGAAPRERFVYAVAAMCPRGPVVQEAQLLHDSGLVMLAQERIGPGRSRYIAIKRARPEPARAGFERVAASLARRPDSAALVLAEIRREREPGEPPLSPGAIARATKLPIETVQRLLGRFQGEGKLTIAHAAPQMRELKRQPRRGVKAGR